LVHLEQSINAPVLAVSIDLFSVSIAQYHAVHFGDQSQVPECRCRRRPAWMTSASTVSRVQAVSSSSRSADNTQVFHDWWTPEQASDRTTQAGHTQRRSHRIVGGSREGQPSLRKSLRMW